MFIFKPLAQKDFKLLYTWLNIDFVTKWYAKRKFSYDDVEKKYGAYVRHEKPTESFIVIYDDVAIGYIQVYRIKDYPEYAACVEVGDKAVGIDMFIGDKNYIGKGLGSKILNQFIQDVVSKMSHVDRCIIGPEPSNKQAIRVYEKAGFSHVKTVSCPNSDDAEYIMMKRLSTETVLFEQK